MGNSPDSPPPRFVSRGGEKLAHALNTFELDPSGLMCADLGCHVGGFTDCLLQYGAAKVYAVDTAYGTLAWKLRKDPRVVVRERCNAMHVELPEPVSLITADLGWTRQVKALPNIDRLLAPAGSVVTLIKPHYEAPSELLKHGVLPDDALDAVVEGVLADIAGLGWTVRQTTDSPIRGHGGNREVLAWLQRAADLA